MVSFQCEGCGDVYTKKKLDSHASRCRNAFTCLDCHVSFYGTEYRSHTSCISEAQKYQGHLYQEKKGPKARQQNKIPRPTVEDFPDTTMDIPKSVSFAKAEVPPPAPMPPSAATPINVFDFLQKNNEEDENSDTSTSSSFVSGDNESDRSESPEADVPEHNPHANGQPTVAAPHPPYAQGFPPAYGPPYHAYAAYNPELQATPYTKPPPYHISNFQTPAPPTQSRNLEPQSESRSEKKRKRSPSGIDTAEAAKDRGILHTGLTGGLNKLLPTEEESVRAADASPLSPKKRNKRIREDSVSITKTKIGEEDRTLKHKDKHRKSGHESSTALTTTSRNSKESRRSRRDLDGPSQRRAIEYPGFGGRTTKQCQHQAKSDFFISLIDKDHKSIKGQSVWGLLKMFHESRQEGTGYDESSCRAEEKKLLKGLRCKIGKAGEIILFARPEAEGE